MRPKKVLLFFFLILFVLAGVFFVFTGVGQKSNGAEGSQPLDESIIHHKSGQVSVVSNDPRPLYQAITAVREEYGWSVDYEDPQYSESELIDAGDPNWRRSHRRPPRPGSKVVAGDSFRTDFNEDLNVLDTPDGQRVTLEKIVSDYNLSGNPGHFIARDEGDGHFAVIGIPNADRLSEDSSSVPILDTRVSIPIAERSIDATIRLILEKLSAAGKTKVDLGTSLANLYRFKVTVGGDDVPARILLHRAFDRPGSKTTWIWSLLYDFDLKMYVLNPTLTSRAQRDPSGKKKLVPVASN